MENNLDNVEKDKNSVQEKNKNSAWLTVLCSVISSSIVASSMSISTYIVFGRKLDEISKKLDEIDKKLDEINASIDEINKKLSNDLEDTHQELDSINNRLDNLIDLLENQTQNMDNITIPGSYGDTILVNDNASIYALPDLATPLTPYYQNSDMQRVIGGAIMMDENQNSYVAMTEEDMADLTSKGYTVYGYLALNEYSQNAYDYEGVYLASDVTVLDKDIYQTRSLHR